MWVAFSFSFLLRPLAVFDSTPAFKQMLCSLGWQKHQSQYLDALHSRIFCCNAGSHLKVDVDPLKTGPGHGMYELNWITPDDEACGLCPAGQYSDSLNTNKKCTPAARDEFVPAPGINTATNCSDNPGPKSFTNPPNTSLCEICPAGKKMIRGTTATNCTKCDAGQFQDLSGKETCHDCPAGYYQDQIGIAYCVGCIPGQFQNEKGQQECQECLPGQHRLNTIDDTDLTTCVNCPTGKVMPLEGAAKCVDCIPGQFQDQKGEQQCKDCLAGQHRLNTINGTNLTKCMDCPIGKVMPVTGAAKCVDCIPGQYQDQKGNESCIKCASGRKFNANIDVGISASNCEACAKGQYQPENSSTFCLPCLTGTFQNVTGSSSCNDCPIGFSNGDTKEESCSECKAGKFQDAIQEANCKGMLFFL